MNWTEESLRVFGKTIQRLINKESLSRPESYEMFRQVILNTQPDLHQGAFLSALVAKGESPEEIAGAWQAIVEFDTAAIGEELGTPLVENSGTGMDRLKTFNVSTAAAVVASAGGAKLARHGARALTSSCGTVDLAEALGVDVECTIQTVLASIRQSGIGLFNGMSPRTHPRSLARILSQIRFGSTLNIAASLASPCRPTHALRGVYSRELVPKVSAIMRLIGYERAMVVHGLDQSGKSGIDEISGMGETLVQEIHPDGTERRYTLAPEDFGLKRSSYSSIAAIGDAQREAVRFVKIISGTGYDECIDMTCLNAGAILYLVDKAADIQAGFELSRSLIASGKALGKLAEWVSTQSDPSGSGIQRFQNILEKAGVAC